jgi:hypothetical protein
MTRPARVAALTHCRCRECMHRSYDKFFVIPIHFTGPAYLAFYFQGSNITHLAVRHHYTFHQLRFNLSYPSRQFPIPLKVKIAWKFSVI